MKSLFITALAGLLLAVAAPAEAAPSKLENDMLITGNLSFSNGKGIATPAAGQTARIANNQFIISDTFATMQKTLLVQAPLVIDSGGSITGTGITSAKRQCFVIPLSPNTGAAADSTLYRGVVFPGRAGTVTKITLGCQTAPTVGTNLIKVLKGGSSGNTMLNAATFNANTLVANTATDASLTATAADLTLTAAQPIYAEYSAGAQTVDGIGLVAVIEFQPDDF